MKQQHFRKGQHAQACGPFSFPGEIISQDGAASLAASIAKGKTALFCDKYVLRQFGPKIKNNTEMEHVEFSGECSPGNFFRIKTLLLENKFKTLVAAGGGKTLDLAKYLKREIPGLFLINIPTSAATCAAATPVSVLYDEKGLYKDTLDTLCPDALIIDYEIFYDLPMPFFSAGAIDTLAKYYEAAVFCERYQKPDVYDLFMLQTIKGLYLRLKKLIIEKWARPELALKKELTDIIIKESGQLSCMARYTVTAGLAHAIAHSVTASAGAKQFLHGEHVSAGLIIQEQYLKNAERLAEIENLAAIMDLPVSFMALGVTKKELAAAEKLFSSIVSREKIFIPKSDVLVYNIVKAGF